MLRKSINSLLQTAVKTSTSKITLSASLTPVRNYISGFPVLSEKNTVDIHDTATAPMDESYSRKMFPPVKQEIKENKLEVENNKSFSNKK